MRHILFLLPALLGIPVSGQDASTVPPPQPPDRTAVFSDIDSMMTNSISCGVLTGAVVCVGHESEIIFEKAYGRKMPSPDSPPMETGCIFDIASITKAVATAPAVMTLVEQGAVRLDDPIGKYLPETESKAHRGITVRQLLTHYSGLTSTIHPQRTRKRRQRVLYGKELLNAVYRAPIEARPGTEFIYSDLGYILLGKLVERTSGMRLDRYVQKKIFAPLAMNDTSFCPAADRANRISFSEEWSGHVQRGTVQDPIAGRLNGIAGHAGVFSTTHDLARFAMMMLGGGALGEQRILKSETVSQMVSPQSPEGKADIRGLGWDINSRYSSLKGEFFPSGSYGHTGYTGTSLWIDPQSKTFVILLTCRSRLDDNLAVRGLRTGLSNLVGSLFYPGKVKEKGL